MRLPVPGFQLRRCKTPAHPGRQGKPARQAPWGAQQGFKSRSLAFWPAERLQGKSRLRRGATLYWTIGEKPTAFGDQLEHSRSSQYYPLREQSQEPPPKHPGTEPQFIRLIASFALSAPALHRLANTGFGELCIKRGWPAASAGPVGQKP